MVRSECGKKQLYETRQQNGQVSRQNVPRQTTGSQSMRCLLASQGRLRRTASFRGMLHVQDDLLTATRDSQCQRAIFITRIPDRRVGISHNGEVPL